MKNFKRNHYIFGILLLGLILICNHKAIINAVDSQTVQENTSTKTDFFDADGSFYLEKDIIIDGISFHGFVIFDGVSYYNDGKLDYENPVLKEPKANISILAKDRKQKEYSCKEAIITREKLLLRAEQTLIGDVLIEGRFLDKRGQFWNYSSEGKNVVQAKVCITKKGKEIYSAVKFFKYWSGD